MSTPSRAVPERSEFGRVIQRWFKANRWPQDVPHRLAKVTGAQGPWNSQISCAMNGKLDPKPAFFLAFGAFNDAVARQSYPGVTDRKLLDQLKGATPLAKDDGTPYSAVEFFALFAGMLPSPEAYQELSAGEEISDEEAKARSEALRRAFQDVAKDQMLSPKEAWESLRPHIKNLDASALNRFKEVLSGWGDYSGAELMELATSGPYSEPGMALETWASGVDGISGIELAREARAAVER